MSGTNYLVPNMLQSFPKYYKLIQGPQKYPCFPIFLQPLWSLSGPRIASEWNYLESQGDNSFIIFPSGIEKATIAITGCKMKASRFMSNWLEQCNSKDPSNSPKTFMIIKYLLYLTSEISVNLIQSYWLPSYMRAIYIR